MMFLPPCKNEHLALLSLSEELNPKRGSFKPNTSLFTDLYLKGEPLIWCSDQLPRHQQGDLQGPDYRFVLCSSHLPYLVFIIKTCLLKHTFLLPNTWKIYDCCVAFCISVLNSVNTQVIFFVITDDFSSSLKLGL